MKTLQIPFTIFCLLAISVTSAQAAKFASAKVLSVKGEVTKFSASGGQSRLKVGNIIVEGDRINSSASSRAALVFSNGSEITINENSCVKMEILSQDVFDSNLAYSQLEADPSKSRTIIKLNYGQLRGKVKKLSKISSFWIKTRMGTASMRGSCETIVKYNYEQATKEFQLNIKNVKGLCDFIGQGNANYYAIDNVNGDSEEVKNEFNGESLTNSTALPEETALVVTCGQQNPVLNTIIEDLAAVPGIDIATTTDGNVSVAVVVPVIPPTGSGNYIPAPVITPEDASIITPSMELQALVSLGTN